MHDEEGGVEACDDGGENGVPGPDNNCTDTCQVNVCGDGFASGAEACDDGDTTPGDGCSATCTAETCGNGVVDFGETCDEGVESATCDGDCSEVKCGDGYLNAVTEACDDGGQTAACDLDCTDVDCGDGTVNSAAGETCDDGNDVPGDGCFEVQDRELRQLRGGLG